MRHSPQVTSPSSATGLCSTQTSPYSRTTVTPPPRSSRLDPVEDGEQVASWRARSRQPEQVALGGGVQLPEARQDLARGSGRAWCRVAGVTSELEAFGATVRLGLLAPDRQQRADDAVFALRLDPRERRARRGGRAPSPPDPRPCGRSPASDRSRTSSGCAARPRSSRPAPRRFPRRALAQKRASSPDSAPRRPWFTCSAETRYPSPRGRARDTSSRRRRRPARDLPARRDQLPRRECAPPRGDEPSTTKSTASRMAPIRLRATIPPCPQFSSSTTTRASGHGPAAARGRGLRRRRRGRGRRLSPRLRRPAQARPRPSGRPAPGPGRLRDRPRLLADDGRRQVVLISSRDASEFGASSRTAARAASSRKRNSPGGDWRRSWSDDPGGARVWTLALLVAAGATVLVATSDHVDAKLATILLAVPIELVFVASGILARVQRPENRTGILLILVGFAWTLGALTTSDNDFVFTLGLATSTLFTALLAHLLLGISDGQPRDPHRPTDRRGVLRGRRHRTAARLRLRRRRHLEQQLRRAMPDQPPLDVPGPAGRERDRVRLRARGARARVARARPPGPALAARVGPRSAARSPVLLSAPLLIDLAVLQTLVGLRLGGRGDGDQLVRASGGARGSALVPLRPRAAAVRGDDPSPRRGAVPETPSGRGPGGAPQRPSVTRPRARLPDRAGLRRRARRPLELPAAATAASPRLSGTRSSSTTRRSRDQPELEEVSTRRTSRWNAACRSARSSRASAARPRCSTRSRQHVPRLARRTFIEFRLSETARLPIDRRRARRHERARRPVAGGLRGRLRGDEARARPRHGRGRRLHARRSAGDPLRHLEARIVKSGQDESSRSCATSPSATLQQQALEALVDEQAALSRVAVAVATDTARDPLRRRDGGGRPPARRGRGEPRPLRPAANEGVIVGKWSEPGVPIRGAGTRVDLLGGALERGSTYGPARARGVDDPETHPRLSPA